MTSDPIGLAGGLNTFGYVYQNPVSNIDPQGLICLSPAAIAGISGAIGGGVAGGFNGLFASKKPSLEDFVFGALTGAAVGGVITNS